MADDAMWRRFADPDFSMGPVPIWWWSGEPLVRERLRWQMEQLIAGGVTQALVLPLAPSGPLYGKLADDPPFLTDAWWELFLGACADAATLGFRLWFYDQLGFSGANLQGRLVAATPDFAGASLHRVVRDATAGDVVELSCPAAGEPVAAAVVELDADGQPVAARRVPLDGRTVRVEAADRCRVMLGYAVRRGFDYFSPAACAALLDIVHGELARRAGPHLGTVIPGTFQDELPAMPSWGVGFAAAYRDRFGDDLADRLAWLFEPEPGPGRPGHEQARRTRVRYHRLRAELAERAFFRPLFDWHEAHGLICGYDQQGPARAGDPVGSVDLYADYPRTQGWYGAPGSDHHGDAKIHSSLAHTRGRPRTWIEAFHSSGWGGTIEETFDWLLPWLARGATLYNPHAVYYSTHGGWWEWAPPSTCWRQPYWRHYPVFASAVARLAGLLTTGRHVCDVGVLFPTVAVQAGVGLDGLVTSAAHTAAGCYDALNGRMVWLHTRTGALDSAGVDYDVLDDVAIAAGRVAGGRLVVGGESYGSVVVPACEVLDDGTAARLAELATTGGTVVCIGGVPALSIDTVDMAGTHGAHGPGLARLRAAAAAGSVRVVATPADAVAALPAARQPAVRCPLPVLLREAAGRFVATVFAHDGQTGSTAPFAAAAGVRFDVDTLQQHGYGFRPLPAGRTVAVEVHRRVFAGAAELWDPTTGERHALPARAGGSVAGADDTGDTGDYVTLDVPFRAGPVAVLVFGTGAAEPTGSAAGGDGPAGAGSRDLLSAAPPLPAEPTEPIAALDGEWDVELEPTLDNRWADLADPGAPLPAVQTWRFRTTSTAADVAAPGPDAAWAPAHATFGPYALVAGPGPAGELPADTGPGWQPARYSLSRGIDADPIHRGTLGPGGVVPEEFLHWPEVAAGEQVAFRTSFALMADDLSADAPVFLAVGAAARREVEIDGRPVPAEGAGYLTLSPVRLAAGRHALRVRLTADETGPLRASWALTTDAAGYRRPEWVQPADPGSPGSVVELAGELDLAAPPARAVLQFGTEGPATILVNGREVARQGQFDPYPHGRQVRVQPFDATALLTAGRNRLVVRFVDPGRPIAAFLDGLVTDAAGRVTSVRSDEEWTCSRDGVPVGARLRRSPFGDPRFAALAPRPHPLPDAGWLTHLGRPDPGTGGVLRVVPDVDPGQATATWLAFVLPPGATRMRVPARGRCTVTVDGEPARTAPDGWVDLPAPHRAVRHALVRVAGAGGHRDGAVLAGPVEYAVGPGRLRLGDWAGAGLGSYSGAVVYSRLVHLGGPCPDAVLDLGRVRGSIDVRVDGAAAGTGTWSPYRVRVGHLLHAGDNLLQVRVANTLAPYLGDSSPTPYVFAGQRTSGLFGPVRLLGTTPPNGTEPPAPQATR